MNNRVFLLIVNNPTRQALFAIEKDTTDEEATKKRYSRLPLKSYRRRHRTTQIPSEKSEQRKLADHRDRGTTLG